MSSPSNVRELRRRWKPHKERLTQQRGDHPTVVRFHRACSWLAQAELFDAEQLDAKLLHQWIAFNALYGQWDPQLLEPVADRRSWQAFVARIVELDQAGHLPRILTETKRLGLAILEDAYLNGHFWQEPGPRSAHRARNVRNRALDWYRLEQWSDLCEQILRRIYLLRCQIIHGAATCGGRLNRAALRRCAGMMDHLLLAILLVWIDHGADEDWGEMCYPPLETGRQ